MLDIAYTLTEKVAHQTANQAMVLDVLLLLDDEKIIVLDLNTDESFIPYADISENVKAANIIFEL